MVYFFANVRVKFAFHQITVNAALQQHFFLPKVSLSCLYVRVFVCDWFVAEGFIVFDHS